jgi:hypothetical protein
MIDNYHCPKCSRLLKCEGVVSIQGEELQVFSCDDCVVKRMVFGPAARVLEMGVPCECHEHVRSDEQERCLEQDGRGVIPVTSLRLL